MSKALKIEYPDIVTLYFATFLSHNLLFLLIIILMTVASRQKFVPYESKTRQTTPGCGGSKSDFLSMDDELGSFNSISRLVRPPPFRSHDTDRHFLAPPSD